MRAHELTSRLKEHVVGRGIDLFGITSAEPFVVGDRRKTVAPREILPDARAVIVAGFPILTTPCIIPSEPGKPRGRFSSYGVKVYMPMRAYTAKVVRQFLKEEGFAGVSTPKIPAKMAAVRAGLGKYGKNSVVITDELGSWVMFETIVTDAPLACEDHSLYEPICGGCSLCLAACPTQAIVSPYKIDRARCITDWLWGTFVPAELREKQENRLFGCGECLMACPKNRHLTPRAGYPVPVEETSDCPELIPLVTANDDYYKQVISAFPRWAGVDAIRGNAIVALGNIADPSATDALAEALHHSKPQIRAYAAWALGRIGDRRAKENLRAALAAESNAEVIQEIRWGQPD